uniref:Uncharacterized protein n=1 Tax=Romanomermis culicivorax TaxID=13658 RepID=A0A915KDL3_ROMCU
MKKRILGSVLMWKKSSKKKTAWETPHKKDIDDDRIMLFFREKIGHFPHRTKTFLGISIPGIDEKPFSHGVDGGEQKKKPAVPTQELSTRPGREEKMQILQSQSTFKTSKSVKE